jgi:threonine dehydratase
MSSDTLPLDRQLRQETLYARERVYRFGEPTPIERLYLPGSEPGPEIWVKREDLSPVKSYKWRGACNRMALLTVEESAKGVVTASAGNHAQGVALTAHILGINARVYMPRSTPRIKQAAVRHHGGSKVEIILSGDSYDEAVSAALADVRATDSIYIHAYDDLWVMAGQGTLADEVVLSGHGPFDVAYLQIGGGGMAGAAANWLKTYWPKIEIIGVEGIGQACMSAALEAGHPVQLQELDIFCDGTAVRKAGTLPFQICQQVLSRIETVANAEVGSAIRVLWENLRCISEPSGAMGLAAVLKNRTALAGKRVLIVISGANIDFLQLGLIAQSERGDSSHSRSLSIHIPESAGALLALLDSCFAGLEVIDLQYGKNSESTAILILTISSDNTGILEALPKSLDDASYQWENLTESDDVHFRAIPFRPDLLNCPVFLRLDFYERPGALHDFLDRQVRNRANICYFNYRHSGERIGRALIGLEFTSEAERTSILKSIPEHGEGYRSCKPVDASTFNRLCP